MDTRLNNGMCRCCASEGTFKDICSTYHWMGDEEIYSDMLKECFDINLNTLEAGDEGGICEVCITQLRNASNFKKQVLQTEQHFKKRLQDKLFKTSIVKVELPAPDEEVDSDNDNNISEDFSGPEYEVPIKLETQDEPKGKKRAAKATTSRAKKAKLDDGEPSTKRNPDHSVNNDVDEDDDAHILVVKDNENDKETKSEKDYTELDKHFYNITEILKNSNATPFKRWVGDKYTCCWCAQQFNDPDDLKVHTLRTHEDASKACFMKARSVYEYAVKLDITLLYCTLCAKNINNIEDLIYHFIVDHEIEMFIDINNQIIPFNFESEYLKCFVCSEEFDEFNNLLEHMTTHYSNYLCESCSMGCINLKQLIDHSKTHVAPFNCSYCTEAFDSNDKKEDHEHKIHGTPRSNYECEYCNETIDWERKTEHLSKVHAIRSLPIVCRFCKSTFDTRAMYSSHLKQAHLKLKEYACDLCNLKFPTPSLLKDHVEAHDKSPEPENVQIKSPDVIKPPKMYEDDEANYRFKCGECGQIFLRQNNLIIHMTKLCGNKNKLKSSKLHF